MKLEGEERKGYRGRDFDDDGTPNIRIKQHGLKRTGTNASRMILMTNYHVNILPSALGHKHWKPQPDGWKKAQIKGVLINTRHPLPWLWANYRFNVYWAKEYGKREYKKPWDKFAMDPRSWELYNRMQRLWIEKCKDYKMRYCVLRMETFAHSMQGQFLWADWVADKLKLEERHDRLQFKYIDRHVNNDSRLGPKFKPEKTVPLLAVREHFNPKMLSLAHTCLDKKLLKALGYSLPVTMGSPMWVDENGGIL